MQAHLLLSVSSQDKPGVVEAISSVIEGCGGSWLESRLAHLSGKFVGVIRVRIDESRRAELQGTLQELSISGISISVETQDEARGHAENNNIVAKFSAIGPDRVGIVKEISSAFVRKGINVEELETNLSSMPYSGEPIFEATGLISVPGSVDIKELHEKLDAIANDLGLSLELEQSATS